MALTALVHLGAGIGNVVLATPLLQALQHLGLVTDVLLAADYAQTAELLRPWSAVRSVFLQTAMSYPAIRYDHVLPAIPPFYALQYGRNVKRQPHAAPRPPDALFYADEQEYYFTFARSLGLKSERPAPCLPIPAGSFPGVTSETVVLAPGCKTGEMAAKRWPRFVELAEGLENVVVVGTPEDLTLHDGSPMRFPSHVRSFVGKLTLRQTAELIASAGALVGNDSGLSHIAAAVGTRTVMIFGPTPDATLGKFSDNVQVLRRGLPCEPCWFKSRFSHCQGSIRCLAEIQIETVQRAIERALA